MGTNSIIPNNQKGMCYICGKECRTEEHHIFEGSARRQSEEYGLKIDVCRDCHNLIHSMRGQKHREYIHALGQQMFEEQCGTREEFIKKFIRSYL